MLVIGDRKLYVSNLPSDRKTRKSTTCENCVAPLVFCHCSIVCTWIFILFSFLLPPRSSSRCRNFDLTPTFAKLDHEECRKWKQSSDALSRGHDIAYLRSILILSEFCYGFLNLKMVSRYHRNVLLSYR